MNPMVDHDGSVPGVRFSHGKAVLFDCDGTLVDVSGLRDWVTGKRTDYHEFHMLSASAKPIPWVVRQAQQLWDTGWDVLIVTARDTAYRQITLDWLAKHNVPYNQVYMRPLGDARPDYDIKSDILALARDDGYDPYWAFDDNPSVIPLWESELNGCTRVPGWED